MASVKVRSRKGGSAVPLDDTDRQLLNLMQGSFALTERPFAHVADQAGLGEDEVMSRVQYLLDKRIIREVTPIFDTRALGYSSMLVAAKVDAANPHRAAPTETQLREIVWDPSRKDCRQPQFEAVLQNVIVEFCKAAQPVEKKSAVGATRSREDMDQFILHLCGD